MPDNMGNGETGEGGWYYINILLTKYIWKYNGYNSIFVIHIKSQSRL